MIYKKIWIHQTGFRSIAKLTLECAPLIPLVFSKPFFKVCSSFYCHHRTFLGHSSEESTLNKFVFEMSFNLLKTPSSVYLSVDVLDALLTKVCLEKTKNNKEMNYNRNNQQAAGRFPCNHGDATSGNSRGNERQDWGQQRPHLQQQRFQQPPPQQQLPPQQQHYRHPLQYGNQRFSQGPSHQQQQVLPFQKFPQQQQHLHSAPPPPPPFNQHPTNLPVRNIAAQRMHMDPANFNRLPPPPTFFDSTGHFNNHQQQNLPPPHHQAIRNRQPPPFSLTASIGQSTFGNFQHPPAGSPLMAPPIFGNFQPPPTGSPFLGPSTFGNFQPPPTGPPLMTPSTFGNFQPPPAGARHSPVGQFPSAHRHSLVSSTPLDAKAEFKEAMKDVVAKWARSRCLDKESKSEPKEKKLLKIHEYKDVMRQLMLKVEQLRQLNDSLAENMETNLDTWTALTVEVKKCKDEVIELQAKLLNNAQVEHISNLIKQRKKKRLRLRNQKKRSSEEHLKSLSRRIKLNEKIDEWRHKENAKLHMEKMIESLKNEAGESLTEVKRKQTEAKELIEVFKLLKELREIHKETAIYKGIFVTEQDDEVFNEKVEQATDLLCKQKRLYEDEERALRVLREEEAEDFERIEVEKRKRRKQRGEDDLSSVDPMLMFRMYWLQGEDSVAGLVHVRSLWDRFLCLPLTPGASRIPENWPEPCQPSSKEWERYVVKPLIVKKRNPRLNESAASED